MGRINSSLLALNRGEVSRYALARIDVERMRLSAETQVNWMPWVLGPMMLRPGLGYIGDVKSDAVNRLLPFIFGPDDAALLEFTDSTLRVWVDDALVTRPSVSTVVTNGDFSSSAGWTTSATSGCTCNVNSTVPGALYMAATARGGIVSCLRSVSVAAPDQNVAHGLRIVVTRGPVTFMVGSTSGGGEYISSTELGVGTHSLAFTPTGATFYVKFESNERFFNLVDSITIDTAGTLEIPSPYVSADLSKIRYDQSGDVVFLGCDGYQQRKIERRANNSWSIVLYESRDGPFRAIDTNDVTLTPSAYEADIAVTASRPVFKSGDVGKLFRLFSNGQLNFAVIGAGNTFSEPTRVNGVSNDRVIGINVSGVWVGTISLQRSIEGPDTGFVNIPSSSTGWGSVPTLTGNFSINYYDNNETTDGSYLGTGYDNVVAWYRIGFESTNYTSGSANVYIAYSGGGRAGVVRVTTVNSSTSIAAQVMKPLSNVTPTSDWMPSDWSDTDGWPSVVGFHDGRLFWAGRDKIWGSVSDDYTSFDLDKEGDAGPISRSVGFGPVENINWLLPLTRLIVGRQGAETSIRSSSLDEPLTPTNFTLKDCSTQGSAPIPAVKIDKRGIFVQQSNRRVFELAFSVDAQDYNARDLTRLNVDIGKVGFVDVDVQRQPDTQIHFVREDGQVAALLYDVSDEVDCWWRIETDGEIENVCILPGSLENQVYYSIKRTINGSVKRYIEKMARRDQCTGQPEARCADSYVLYTGGSSNIPVAHLEGEEVVAWGWNDDADAGVDMRSYTVSGGIIEANSRYDNVIVGLPYTAQFKSAKLAYAAQKGTAVNQKKKVNRIGLVLADTHPQGVEYGQSFDVMDDLPLVEVGADVDQESVHAAYDEAMITMPGEWDTDARLCLQASAPRPAMVMGVVVDVTTND
jgi:hypothetical protein